jgi:hypothetical protein
VNGAPVDATAGSVGGGLPQRVRDLVLFVGSRLPPDVFEALTAQVALAVGSSWGPTLIEVALPPDVPLMKVSDGQLPVAGFVLGGDIRVGRIIVWVEQGKVSAVEQKPLDGVAPLDWPCPSSVELADDSPAPPEPEALFDELAAVGVFITSVWDLVNDPADYPQATSVLLRWLVNLDDAAPESASHPAQALREGIVRGLMVKSAKPAAAPALIEQFRRFGRQQQSHIGWTIGAALQIVTDDASFDDLAELVLDPTYGRSRQELVLALGRMTDPRAASIARQVLADDDLVAHAVIVLGKLKSLEARADIAHLANHQRPFVRREVRKALARIDRAHPHT